MISLRSSIYSYMLHFVRDISSYDSEMAHKSSYNPEMKIIPAVDIKDGKCTQLVGGKLGTEKFYGSPVESAMRWEERGAEILHVIDLDAALGTGSNLNEIIEIKNSTNIPVQVGGGIRKYEDAKKLLEAGIDKIIAGTFAHEDYFNDLKNLKKLKNKFGKERLIVAVDSKKGKVVIRGWQQSSDFFASEFVKNFEEVAWGFLYTDVDVEGRMKGVNLSGIKKVVSATELPVIVSGGISSAEDIKNIKEAGAYGVVLGKALYEEKILFEDLLKI